jgi:hypothetical protein
MNGLGSPAIAVPDRGLPAKLAVGGISAGGIVVEKGEFLETVSLMGTAYLSFGARR